MSVEKLGSQERPDEQIASVLLSQHKGITRYLLPRPAPTWFMGWHTIRPTEGQQRVKSFVASFGFLLEPSLTRLAHDEIHLPDFQRRLTLDSQQKI